VQIKWEKNEKGQFIPKDVPGTEKVVPAQLVLLAMGFLGPEQSLLDGLGVERDPRTNVKAELANTPRASRTCSRRAIVVVVRASSSGPSMKVVGLRAR